MKFSLTKNPVVTLLCHFTGKQPDEFQCDGVMAYYRVSKKPEVWRPFHLPVNTVVAWNNFNLGFAAPYEVEIDPEWLYYTDWKKRGFTLTPIKK